VLVAAKAHIRPDELQTTVVGDARVIRQTVVDLGLGDVHVHGA
jgi:hypothetical protein